MYYISGFLFIVVLTDYLSTCNGLLYDYVTCGSVIKLQNTSYKSRLHSHEVQYGSGSGQQSVTAIQDQDDVNSHWVVKGLPNKVCQRGERIQCGTSLRLQHLATGRNLHSHLFSAPLSKGQEVSAFGKDGVGDTGDYWILMCDNTLNSYWRRDDDIRLKHQDTSMYLAISGTSFGHPIPGQLEVYAVSHPDSATYWRAGEGVFIKPTELSNDHRSNVHIEL